MKKDKEWLIKRVENYIPLNDKTVGRVVDNILDIIHQLDEPEVLSMELPVIPKYVADWITQYRKVFDLYPALRLLENNTLVWGRIYEWYRMNTHKFVNAYLTGEYEVEEEPLYYALVKGHELVYDNAKYWVYDTWSQGDIFVGNRVQLHSRYRVKFGKSEWKDIGINDSNADFVKVDEELN